MRIQLPWYVYSLLVIALSACSRKSPDSSSIHISLPSAPSQLKTSSNESQSAPAFCFYVNVTGSGITPTTSDCAPPQGLNTGFVDPLSSVTLTVPKGTGRTVELYGYIPKATETCGVLGAALTSATVNRLFRLAQQTAIDMTGDQTTVDLTESFPGLNQFYAIQSERPTTCYAGLTPVDNGSGSSSGPTAFQLSVDSRVAIQQGQTAATGVKLIGRIGSTLPKATLVSPDGVKLQVK